MAAPMFTLVGERVALGPLRRDLVPTYARWSNDLAIARTREYPPLPVTVEQRQAWFERAARDTDTITFTIYERISEQAIGLTSLHHIDRRHGTAEYGITIGESAAHGKGYGIETTRLMLAYAFDTLGLRNVLLLVYEYNLAGRRAYAKAGFREIGRRRQSHWVAGRLWDVVLMDCLASEVRRTTPGELHE